MGGCCWWGKVPASAGHEGRVAGMVWWWSVTEKTSRTTNSSWTNNIHSKGAHDWANHGERKSERLSDL